MTDFWFCPNCEKPLSGGEGSLNCEHCGANFHGLAAWRPFKGEVGVADCWFCPNCKKPLSEGEGSLTCEHCEANFHGLTVWRPFKGEMGVTGESLKTKKTVSVGDAIIHSIGRLLLAALIWLVILMGTLYTAIPYGGGNRFLSAIWVIATFVLPIWGVLPIFKSLLSNKQ